MKNENLIHVKLEYEEALQSKKDILSSEINLIKIMKIIRSYHFLRLKELKIRSKLHRQIKEVITNIKKVQTTLPKLKIPEILQKGKLIETEPTTQKKTIKEPYYDKDLEYQLKDIQEKLKELQK